MKSGSPLWSDPRSQRDKDLALLADNKMERQPWDTQAKQISQFMLPFNSRFLVTDRQRGDRRFNNIYDNAATKSLRVMGAGMMSGATSASRPWFRLATPDRKLMKSEPVKIWLNEVTQAMLAVFARSNFYRAVHIMYEEMGAFGTAGSVVMDNFERVLHLNTMTFGEYYLGCDQFGVTNQLSREFEMTVGNMVREFGYYNCSLAVRNAFDKGNYSEWVPVVHIIDENINRDKRKFDNQNMRFSSRYLEPGNTGNDKDTYLRVGGMRNFRALTPRWAVTSNDIYGHGPGHEALGDVKQLQHEQLRKGEAIDYQTKPPLQVPVKLKGRALDRLPGGVSYYDQTTAQGGVRTMFDVQLRLDTLLADIEDVRERIRSSFYVDLFLMLSNMDRTQKTATEVVELHEEKLLMMGPVLERVHNELLEPAVDIAFQRLVALRKPDGSSFLPAPPPELQGLELQVEFVSVLAQAQRAVETNTIDRYTMALGNVAMMKPGVLDKFDEDTWAEIYADRLGVDPQLVVPSETVALIRQDRAEKQQQAQQMAMMQAGADTAAKLSQAKTGEPNALTALTQGAPQ